MKGKIAALVAGIAIGSTGVALGQSNKTGRTVTPLRVGDYVVIPAVDLACGVFRRDPARAEPGAMLYCGRPSVGANRSRTVAVTRYHYLISGQTGSGYTYRIPRSP